MAKKDKEKETPEGSETPESTSPDPEVNPGLKTNRTAAQVKQDLETATGRPVRSGGPVHADPNNKPVTKDGDEVTHPPDLADNGTVTPVPFNNGRKAPIDITTREDELDVSERIRTAEKADVLYYWHEQERNAESPRQSVLDAIRDRLLEVQGPPLPDEIENASNSDAAAARRAEQTVKQ